MRGIRIIKAQRIKWHASARHGERERRRRAQDRDCANISLFFL